MDLMDKVRTIACIIWVIALVCVSIEYLFDVDFEKLLNTDVRKIFKKKIHDTNHRR